MQVILRYKNAIVIMAVVALFIVVDYNLITGYFEQIGQLGQKKAELETVKQTLREWKSVGNEFEIVSEGFLTDDVQLFKKSIEGSAEQYNVSIVSLSISNEDKDYYWEANMDLRIKCSYANFVEFISDIETESIEVKKVSILSNRDNRNAVISITLRGYILKK